MTEVPFPSVAGDQPDAEGVVATWFVDDGERIEAGALLCEVAVDKVDMEVLAPASGTVRLLVKEGGVVRQGTPIARIE